MSATKKVKKASIWIMALTSILSLFGVPIAPQVASVVGIVSEAIQEVEDLRTDKVIDLMEIEDE